MNFDGKIKDLGPLSHEALAEAVSQISVRLWKSQHALRVSRAGMRAGRALFFYFPIMDQGAYKKARESGEVFEADVKRLLVEEPITALVEELLSGPVAAQYPNASPILVQLAELPAGSVILEHIDKGYLADTHRLHIPLITHEDVVFFVEDEQFFLKPGNLYELNNQVLHKVENNSDVNRVHLMIDLLPHSTARLNYK